MLSWSGMKAIAYDSNEWKTSKNINRWIRNLPFSTSHVGRSVDLMCSSPLSVLLTKAPCSLLCRQSDVVHQSVFELIHTDDRAMFRQQLHFALNPPTGVDGEGKNREWKIRFYPGFGTRSVSGVNEKRVWRGAAARLWCGMSRPSRQCCRVVARQWRTVPWRFPQRTPPSWRGTSCAASAASWTIPLAFWFVVSDFIHLFFWIRTAHVVPFKKKINK